MTISLTDPFMGRWINRDPTTDQIFLNLMSFCGNNPICRFDMDGKSWKAVGGVIAGAILGGVAGGLTGVVTGGGVGGLSGAISGAIAGAVETAKSEAWTDKSFCELMQGAALQGGLNGIGGGLAARFGTLGAAMGGAFSGGINAYVSGATHYSTYLWAAFGGAVGGAFVSKFGDDSGRFKNYLFDAAVGLAANTGADAALAFALYADE